MYRAIEADIGMYQMLCEDQHFLLLYNYYIPRVGIVLITLELIKEMFMHT